MAEDGRLVKQEEDYTAQVDEALPTAQGIAAVRCDEDAGPCLAPYRTRRRVRAAKE